ncbi:ABC transporter ATP-binding protein [Nocardiopsis lucentensis]|uniref:ABC transporter ATP-binding protein n=1 Tax=Nocardiopsis lucentensis TaxID=53441 RepID=UPI00373AE71B
MARTHGTRVGGSEPRTDGGGLRETDDPGTEAEHTPAPDDRAGDTWASPGTPDARGPWRYLWWLIAAQPRRVLTGAFWGTVWMVGLMVPPYLVARAVDDGLRAGNRDALLFWVLALLAAGAVNTLAAVMRHRTMTLVRADASLRTLRVVARHAARLGADLSRRISTGELSTIQVTDVGRIAHVLTMTGPGVGAVVAYTGTAVLLFTIDPLLGTVVVVGVPLLALSVGPMLSGLRGRQSAYRDREGELTELAGDIVAGLRVLTGLGGRERFASRYRERSAALLGQGYRVGAADSWFAAVSSCLPLLFVAAVTWISARLAVAEVITVGEMVAVYGYVAVLVVPVFFLVEAAGNLTHGHVSLRRVVRLLALLPRHAGGTGSHPGPEGPAELVDGESGLRVAPGSMTALVSADPVRAAAVVERLAHPSDASWGGVTLRDLDPEALRDRVLVSDNESYVFAGPLREVVGVHGDRNDAEIMAALSVAGATDVLSSLGNGLDSEVRAQGRNLSGGQRQRLRLARAVLADPEVLILVEPTSAVDARTEADVIARLHEAREERTTLVVGTSPLLLERADRVVLLVDGVVAAEGTHGELLAGRSDYRSLLLRETSREPRTRDDDRSKETKTAGPPEHTGATERTGADHGH